jgi:type II secretory pathway component GspD/PulD (secretin)
MNKALILFALALFPATVFSQSATSPGPSQRVTKVVRIYNEIPQKIADVLAPGSSVMVTADNTLGVVVLKGKPEDVATAEQTIKELDVPPAAFSTANDIELIVYLIGGSNNSTATSDTTLAAVQPVIKQLSVIFPYTNYELLSTMLLRSQQGKATESLGILNYKLSPEASKHPAAYGIAYHSASVSSDKAKPVIHLEGFRFNAQMGVASGSIQNATQYQMVDIGTKSDLDLREGQKVVIGKTDVATDGSAIFIVLTAKLVD